MNFDQNWEFYLTRPFDIFGASFWAMWYDHQLTQEIIGARIPHSLMIEEHPHIARRYVIPPELKLFKKAISNLILKQPARSISILKHGLIMNQKAEDLLNGKQVLELPALINFSTEHFLCSSLFPFFCYDFLLNNNIKESEMIALAEQLRSVSYYHQILDKLVLPLAKQRVGSAAEMMTISEIISNKPCPPERKFAKQANKRFIYEYSGGQETIEWVGEVQSLIEKLEGVCVLESVKGKVAFKGEALGTARLILGNDLKVPFTKGDILITITTNPLLLPLMQKAAAIVTDEGGIASHAAILSREMKKPCIVGTKFATSVFKNGDLVKVDANKGTVTKIK